MGAWSFWFFGKVEQEKKQVLIAEVAKLYKIDTNIVEKGFDLIEKEAKKIHLPSED